MGSAIKTLLVSQSDEKLLELAQHGCEVAFQTLARRYRRPLLRHCRQLCLLEDQAQEVLQRTLSEAWNGLQGQTQPVELAPWLRQIAQAMASEAIGPADSAPSPRPEEVLALRGALAANSPLPLRSQVFMQGRNGNKSQQPVEDAFDLTNSAVRGLLGRTRRGISALTPPPLLAWLAGRAVQSGAGSERIAELGGGGAAGLTGLAVKGGIAALTAGVAITGAVIATSRHQHGTPAGHRVVAASGAGTGSADGVGGSGPPGAGSGYGTAASSRSGRRRETRTQRLRAHLLRSRGGSSAAAGRPASGSTGTSHGSSSHPTAGGAPASSPAAAPQASGAAEQPSAGGGRAAGGGSGTEASGGGGSATPPQGGSGQPSGSGEQSGSGSSSKGGGIGVQVSVETGSGSQSSSSGSGGSTSSGSQSQGTGVGVSISLEPVASVGIHISLP
jgi:hypothetical protein